MTVVVENAMDQVEAYTKGNGVFPVPPEVAADNAKREAKNDKSTATEKADEGTKGKAVSGADGVSVSNDDQKADSADAKGQAEDDDKEGEEGLTPRQKREFTKAMQATIGKKHRMQREAEEFAQSQYREAKMAKERAAKLEADLAALREQLKPAKSADGPKEPDRKDFETDQAYWDAMVDYRVDKKLADQARASAKAEQERFIQEETAHALAKMDRAFEQGPEDFKEVYESADMVLPNYVLEAIKTSDLMPELVYKLGTNPDLAEKIKAMTDGCPPGSARYARAAQRQLVEIGKIESTLTPFSKEKVKSDNGDTPSKTPAKASEETGSAPSKPRVQAPIIKPLSGGSASQVERDEADLTGSQALERWQKKHGVNLTARKRH